MFCSLKSSIVLFALFCLVAAISVSGELIWSEDFNDRALNLKGATGPGHTSRMEGVTQWTVRAAAPSLVDQSDYFRVQNQRLEGRDLGGLWVWESAVIDISGRDKVQFELEVSETGDLEENDSCDISYRIDSGPYVQVKDWQGRGSALHTLTGDRPTDKDWGSVLVRVDGLSGKTLQVKVGMINDGAGECIHLDNVKVTDGRDAQKIVKPDEANTFTIMAANLATVMGDCGSLYAGPGERIIQGLKPDIVAIQEWNVTNVSHRKWVDVNFGKEFHYRIESSRGCGIPNGVVSRWPIIRGGEWWDTTVHDRDLAWVTIDIPGDIPLHVISVHLKAGIRRMHKHARREAAKLLVEKIGSTFSPNDYVAVCGDFNTTSRQQQSIKILRKVLKDDRRPADQNGDMDTNLPRNKPYDYVLPNAALNRKHRTLVIGDHVFPEGMVFDSRLWERPPPPIRRNDSGAKGMQHMAVMKRFSWE